MAKGHLFFQLKMIRKNTKPPIWRRGLVPANITFAQLALILEEMLELPKSADYEFEFYQKKEKLSEWHENMRRGDYYYDFRNAPDHFVNNWLKKEKWFTFRICGNGDSLPEYRIEIEKEMIEPRFSESDQPVACPVLMLTKKPDDDKFWTSSYPANDRFQELFHLEKREAEYHYLDELLKEIYEQQKGLGYCTEMINRDTHTKESAYHAIQNLAKTFNAYSNSHSGAALKESVGMDENEAVEAYKGPVVKNAVMPRQRSTVEKALLIYTQKELLEDAEDLGLQLAGKSKGKIAFEIARYLLDPDHMRGKLLEFSEEELDAFEKLIENPFMKPSDEERDNLEALWDLGYVTVYMDGAYEVPEDAETIYNIIKRNGYREFHRKAVWLVKCLSVFAGFYMAAPIIILYRMYLRDQSLKVSYAEFLKLLDKIPEDLNSCFINGELLLGKPMREDDMYREMQEVQEDVEYYILTKEEIECLAWKGYPASTGEYLELEQYFRSTMGLNEDDSHALCLKVYMYFSAGAMPEDFLKAAKSEKLRLPGGKKEKELEKLLERVNDHTRMFMFRGHTPLEMLEMRPELFADTPVPVYSVEDKDGIPLSVSEDSQSQKKPEPTKKIYPNDPCPCGSGKKYKKCCGRKV